MLKLTNLIGTRFLCSLFATLVLFWWITSIGLGSMSTAYADTGVRVLKEQFVIIPGFHNQFQVVEVVQFQNATSVYQSVKLPLPMAYQSLHVKTNDARYPSDHDTAVLQHFLQPYSKNEVILTYVVPVESQSIGATMTMVNPYEVNMALLYIPIGSLEISAANLLAATQIETIGSTRFRVFTRLGIQSGEPFIVNLGLYPKQNRSIVESGLPIIGQNSTGVSGTFQAIANLVVIFFVLLIGFISIRNTHYQKPEKDEEGIHYEA